jgi:hypothetical protein
MEQAHGSRPQLGWKGWTHFLHGQAPQFCRGAVRRMDAAVSAFAILLCFAGLASLVGLAGFTFHWNFFVKPGLIQLAYENLKSRRFPDRIEIAGLTTYWDFVNSLVLDARVPREVRDRAAHEVERIVQIEQYLGPWARVRLHSTLNAALRRLESEWRRDSARTPIGLHGSYRPGQ